MFAFHKTLGLIFLCSVWIGESSGQFCTDRKYVTRTRIQWNNGERLVTKRGWFGNVKYKYEPYVYSSTQYYTDYETVYNCCPGYKKLSSSQCVPECSPQCPSNAQCIRPNVCQCSSGYFSLFSHPTTIICQPICPRGCPENSHCTAPGVCSCNQGYDVSEAEKCVPICEPSCPENAECLKPNQCACSKGYAKVESMSNNGTLICQAMCSPECPVNSLCSKPNECSCEEGYLMKNGICEPICEPPCMENGFCRKPNQCECLEGYEIGKADKVLVCVAKCENECPENGFCAEPNKCECDQGYVMASNGTCDPVCDPTCPENGKCSGPNECTCLKGYRMVDDHCEPICENECPEYAHCSQPNKCECSNGYQLKLTSSYNLFCEPQCRGNCSTFGKCVQPNRCECLEGYEMDEMEECIPICVGGCLNGLCYRPGVCICNPGYLMGPFNTCEPTCSLPCQNGTCVEPEICQCSEGYRLQAGSVHICEPLCEPACHNGLCVEPNICLCHDNYEPTEMRQGAYNHSYCQKSTTSTVAESSSTELQTTTETSSSIAITTTTLAISPQPQNITRVTPKPTFPPQSCLDQCLCWQEYDEFGSISTQPKCVHICLDSHDKPCRNVTQCHCDNEKLQLLCAMENEDYSEDDPQIYICKIPKPQTTTSMPTTNASNEMKITADPNENAGNLLWLILSSIMGICCLAALVFVVYRKYCQYEDPLVEYEL